MAIERKYIEIDGARYGVMPMKATAGFRFKARLARLAGPAALVAAKSDSAADVVARLLERLTGDEVDTILRELLAGGTVTRGELEVPLFGEGRGVNGCNFDEEFATRYEAAWELLAFAIEVNFAGFFDRLKSKWLAKLASLVPTKASASSSPSTSKPTGPAAG
jgi:hypothetical protein